MLGPPRFLAAPLLLLGTAALLGCAGAQGASEAAARAGPRQSPSHARFESISDPLHVALPVAFRVEGPWLVSDELTSGSTFTEALPSWNVEGAAPFVVDIRVSPDARGSNWSPWLRIGDWGVVERTGDVATAFADGEVEVDVLRLTRPQMRAELRVARADLAQPLDPVVVRTEIVLSDMTQLAARLAACAAEPWPVPVQLTVPARSQRHVGDDIGGRVCSPTSVAMVAAYHGASVPTRQMAETILDPHFEIYGNWNRAVQAAFTFGVPGRLVRVSSWGAVYEYLDSGRPVVASIQANEGELEGAPYTATEGHLLVVTGIGLSGLVHVNDPAASWPGSVPRRYTRAEMESVWFARGGVAYVFEPRLDTKSVGQ